MEPSGQAWSDALDRDLDPRDEGRAYVLRWSADFAFGPARHDRNVHGGVSSGKFDLGGLFFLGNRP